VLRKTFVPKSKEVTREWRRLHKEELHDLYSSQNVSRLIKARRKIQAGHVAGEEKLIEGFGGKI
jgi:hypothetical protein